MSDDERLEWVDRIYLHLKDLYLKASTELESILAIQKMA
jgi:hypothetical protein